MNQALPKILAAAEIEVPLTFTCFGRPSAVVETGRCAHRSAWPELAPQGAWCHGAMVPWCHGAWCSLLNDPKGKRDMNCFFYWIYIYICIYIYDWI